MSRSGNAVATEGVAAVVDRVRAKGVRLWSENGELRYRAPKGVLTREELQQLVAAREAILEIVDDGAANLSKRGHVVQAPLTFTQLARWRYAHLYRRPGVRQLFSALRLRGPLQVDLLRESLAKVVERHDALRTQIVILDGEPTQLVSPHAAARLHLQDLSSMPDGAREAEITRLVEECVLEPVALATDALFAVRLIKLRSEEHVLVLAMEHIVSDAASMRVLSRDLFTWYRHLAEGKPLELPEVGTPFAEFATRQARAHLAWRHTDGLYWQRHLKDSPRVRFPQSAAVPGAEGWRSVAIQIDADLKKELMQWCRVHRTTLVMSVFTAFVAVVFRWTDVRDMVVRYQTDGRVSPDVENTIGYFASILHLRLQLDAGATFETLLERLTQEYCNAYERADLSFIDAQLPKPEFTYNTGFNWIPYAPAADVPARHGSEEALAAEPIVLDNPVLKRHQQDSEPVVLLYDTETQIVGGVHFPANRYLPQTMQRFARNFEAFVQAMVRGSGQKVEHVAVL